MKAHEDRRTTVRPSQICPPDLPPKRWLRRNEGFVLVFVTLVVVILGFVGFQNQTKALGSDRTWLGSFYASLQLFVMEYSGEGPVGWPLEFARLAAPMTAAYTAVRALMLLFEERVQLLRLRFGKNHAIVAGLGEMGMAMTRSLRQRGVPVVVIEQDSGCPLIAPAREMGAIVLTGDARDRELLRKARVSDARHLVAVCSDGTNAEIAIRAADLVSDRVGGVLQCRVHIVDPTLCRLLMTHEMARRSSGRCRTEYFNVFESGARSLLAEYPFFDPLAVRRPSRVVVVGTGELGRSVILRVAQEWRYASDGDLPKLRITVIDPQATARVQELLDQQPRLGKACDLEPVDAGITSPDWRKGSYLESVWDPDGLAAVYVCTQVDADAIAAGLFIGPQVAGSGIPVVACLGHRSGLGSLLDGGGANRWGNLRAFGLFDQTCDYELLFAGAYETIARAQHAQYVAAERLRGTDPAINPSMVPWHELPEVLKESNRDQAAHIGLKLAAVGCEIEPMADWDCSLFEFSAAETETLARLEHERWVAERERMGWSSGKAKDLDKRITPYLVPWEELAEPVREHDRIVVRGLPAFLSTVGFEVARRQGARMAKV